MMSRLKYRLFLWCSEYLLPIIVRLLGITWSISISNLEYLSERPIIYTIWHGHLLIHYYAFRNRKIKVLVSRSPDGELIARALKKLGYGVIRGSSSKGGSKAILEILNRLSQGEQIAITPDGPRGPGYRVKEGVSIIAQKSGSRIIPAVVTFAKPTIRLKSWDSFIIPLPFAKIHIEIKEPLQFGSEDSRADICRKIEDAMNIV